MAPPSRQNSLLAGRSQQAPTTATLKRLGELLDGTAKAKSSKKQKVSRPAAPKPLQQKASTHQHWTTLGEERKQSKGSIFGSKTLQDAPTFRPSKSFQPSKKKTSPIDALVARGRRRKENRKENSKNVPALRRPTSAAAVPSKTPISRQSAKIVKQALATARKAATKPRDYNVAVRTPVTTSPAGETSVSVHQTSRTLKQNNLHPISNTKNQSAEKKSERQGEISEQQGGIPSVIRPATAKTNPSDNCASPGDEAKANTVCNDTESRTSLLRTSTRSSLSLNLTRNKRLQAEIRPNRAPVAWSQEDLVPILQKAPTAVTKKPEPSGRAAWQDIPRPVSDPTKDKKCKVQSNDNFVRLNLRNGAGACRGARNKKTKRKSDLLREQRQEEWKKKRKEALPVDRGTMQTVVSRNSGVDPVDDFLDGAFCPSQSSQKDLSESNSTPKCSGHQRPCKLCTVRKNTTGNKGRKFYACPLPRGEQCDFFQWAEDTVQATKQALLKNSSLSGFIARQVSNHVTQLQALTVPELRLIAQERGLCHKGKKPQLIARLAIWVRDEVSSGCKDLPESRLANEEHAAELDVSTDEASSPINVESEDENALSSEDLEPTEPQLSKEQSTNSDITAEGKETLEFAELPSDGVESDDGTECSDDDDSVSSEELELVGDKGKRPLALRPQAWRMLETEFDEFETDEVFDHGPSGNEDSEPRCRLRSTLQTMFGHDDFRDGQEWAIRRCLNQQRSLLVAPTGFGKSLCYALPAAMMDGVCVVVSPLLSLIHDQIRVLPPRLPAATLSGKISTSEMAATLDDIIRGRIKIVFVSPERLTSQSFRRMFRSRWNPETEKHERQFPDVSLLCVDEAHCLSQWAHNFRPSYLRLSSMMQMIQPKSVLAITATAGPRVVNDISRSLHIEREGRPKEDATGVRVMKTDRDNIDVKCLLMKSQGERLDKLLKILSPKEKGNSRKEKEHSTCPFEGVLSSGSVIVYVWRQRDAEVVAENIQAAGVPGGVVIYHGGMDATARSRSQSKFMRGKARICVATVAFGLGINKADIEGVIHMYLSNSPEHYLQEIGRAGRDGRAATAIALILDNEVLVRNSLAHSDLASKAQIAGLLSLLRTGTQRALSVLPEQRPDEQPINLCIPLQATLVSCAFKTETIETVVSLLEQLASGPLVTVEGVSYDSVVIAPKRQRLSKLEEREDIVKAIQQCATCLEAPAGDSSITGGHGDGMAQQCQDKRIIASNFGSYAFSVTDCSNCLGIGAEPRHVFAALRRLETKGEIAMVLDTSNKGRTLNLRLTPAGMRVFRQDDQETLDLVVTETTAKHSNTVLSGTTKVVDLNYILHEVSAKSSEGTNSVAESKKSQSLARFQELITNYFAAEGRHDTLAPAAELASIFDEIPSKQALCRDAYAALNYLMQLERSLEGTKIVQLNETKSADYTALAVTKFLHGIASPTVRLDTLRQHPLFGCLQGIHFERLRLEVTKLFEPTTK